MPMTLTYLDFEDEFARQQRDIDVGKEYIRVYNVPLEALSSLPRKGAAVAIADVTIPEPTATFTPHVKENPIRRKVGDGAWWNVTITFVQLEQYGT